VRAGHSFCWAMKEGSHGEFSRCIALNSKLLPRCVVYTDDWKFRVSNCKLL
jgi:hypothetical protein